MKASDILRERARECDEAAAAADEGPFFVVECRKEAAEWRAVAELMEAIHKDANDEGGYLSAGTLVALTALERAIEGESDATNE